jgi:hypothetical protein
MSFLINIHCPLIIVQDTLNYLKMDRNFIKNVEFDDGNFFEGKIYLKIILIILWCMSKKV